MEGKSKENEIFGFCGPDYLNNVDWRVPDHRRSIAASLVQGVYVLERDRQKRRIKHKAVAPIWWEFFNFHCIQILVDQVDSSTFGAIFENQQYNPSQYDHIAPQHRPPNYVIAFRGTMLKIDTIIRDLFLDMKLAFNVLKGHSRYNTSFQAVERIIAKAGAQKVWLAGHSLGAAIVLQVGKEMAKRGCYIETYLFNPPFAILPLKKIANSTHLKIGGIRVVNSVIVAGLYVALKGTPRNASTSPDQMAQHYDQFARIGPWIPYLFVNQHDLISCEYIGYFEHRENMKAWGAGGIERIASMNSLLSLVSDGEAMHLIPHAVVIENLSHMKDKLKFTHGIQQWWQAHLQWQIDKAS